MICDRGDGNKDDVYVNVGVGVNVGVDVCDDVDDMMDLCWLIYKF